MQKFELIFMQHFTNLNEDLDTTKFSRVIACENFVMAQKIANAMLGEKTYASEWLDQILSLKPTEKPFCMYVWDDGTSSWNRVLKKLNLAETDVEFIFDENKNKVGIWFFG